MNALTSVVSHPQVNSTPVVNALNIVKLLESTNHVDFDDLLNEIAFSEPWIRQIDDTLKTLGLRVTDERFFVVCEVVARAVIVGTLLKGVRQ